MHAKQHLSPAQGCAFQSKSHIGKRVPAHIPRRAIKGHADIRGIQRPVDHHMHLPLGGQHSGCRACFCSYTGRCVCLGLWADVCQNIHIQRPAKPRSRRTALPCRMPCHTQGPSLYRNFFHVRTGSFGRANARRGRNAGRDAHVCTGPLPQQGCQHVRINSLCSARRVSSVQRGLKPRSYVQRQLGPLTRGYSRGYSRGFNLCGKRCGRVPSQEQRSLVNPLESKLKFGLRPVVSRH